MPIPPSRVSLIICFLLPNFQRTSFSATWLTPEQEFAIIHEDWELLQKERNILIIIICYSNGTSAFHHGPIIPGSSQSPVTTECQANYSSAQNLSPSPYSSPPRQP